MALLLKERKILLIWIVTTMIALIISMPIVMWLFIGMGFSVYFDADDGFPIRQSVVRAFYSGLISGVVFGIILGFAQGFAIRLFGVNSTGKWIRNSILGSMVGWGITFGMYAFLDRNNKLNEIVDVAIFLIVGLVIGSAQWLVLQHQFSQAWLWILANGIAWPVSIGIVSIGEVSSIKCLLWPIFIPVITGELLVWLKVQKDSGVQQSLTRRQRE